MAAFERGRERRRDLNRFLLDARGELEAIYASGEAEIESWPARRRRSARFRPATAATSSRHGAPRATMKAAASRDLGSGWAPPEQRDLVSVATYNDLVPAFLALLEASGGDFRAFTPKWSVWPNWRRKSEPAGCAGLPTRIRRRRP